MRRHRWIALAVLFLAAAALLLSLGEREPPPPQRAGVEFPQWTYEESVRQTKRNTLVVPSTLAPGPPGTTPEEVPRPRDPFLVALPVEPGSPVVVFEANALRHSRLGERFVACVQASAPGMLEAIQREAGIDPLKDVDRIAYLGDAAVVSGFFGRVPWDEVGSAERYGQEGRIYRDKDLVIGAWRDQVLVFTYQAESARRAIDQLEGRAPVPESGIPEDMTYGEVYGVIPGTAARGLLGLGDRALAERIASLASRVELHVDAMQDVAAVVRVRGEDAAGLADLAKTMGAALAVARVKAQATDDQRLADLLENASVHPAQGEFSLQLALPADRLEAWFQGCGDRASAPRP